jgi:RNA polymerase sigma-70 factor (sigma-E family)
VHRPETVEWHGSGDIESDVTRDRDLARLLRVDHAVTLDSVERGPVDEPSIEALYREHGARLVGLARTFVYDRAAAEDLVQEAFIRFHRHRHRLRQPAAAAGYLRSTVLNLARDHNRRGLMSRRHIDAEARHLGSMGPDPDDAALLDEEQRTVVEAVSSLPLRQRDCIVLRYQMELSYDEIAETLGLTINSVKTHLKRGLATLRSQMEGS